MTVRKVLPTVTAPVTGTTEHAQVPRIALSGATDDSGGPLVDREGKLVGVVTGAATGPADRTVTLAIAMAEVRAFLADKDKGVAAPPAAPVTADPGPPADVTAGDLGPPIADPPDFDARAGTCTRSASSPRRSSSPHTRVATVRDPGR